jgi:hypothetical protein
MILIFSTSDDYSTKQVLNYLYKFDQKFELFLEWDVIEFHYYIQKNIFKYKVFKNNVFLCDGDAIKSVWYRRLDIQVKEFGPGLINDSHEHAYARHNIKTRTEQIERCLQQKKCLGYFGKANFNKIEFLEKCIILDIEIPKTLITKHKSELVEFFETCNGNIITKSLGIPYLSKIEENEIDETWKLGFTARIDLKNINLLPEEFDLSLFQEKLAKKYEIRVFYLNGRCFSEIIFSQSRIESSLDYRTGFESGMRQCNFTLPIEIEKKVSMLMAELSLNTGSIDIVVTTKNQYVFLEVNPNGQFGDVSEITNSNLEFEIANFLMI